jgi:hypothetical protein
VANLQSAFACDAVLTLTYPADLALEEPGLYILKDTARETTPDVGVPGPSQQSPGWASAPHFPSQQHRFH